MVSRAFGSKGGRFPHLAMRGKSGLAGEIGDLRSDTEEAFVHLETYFTPSVLETFTNLLAADVDALKVAAATAGTIQAFTSADWGGVQGDEEMVPPRNVTITTSSHADVDAVVVVVVGRVRNALGVLIAQTENITLTDGGGATDAGLKAFAFVDSVTIPAQGGAGGSLSIGFGLLVGLAKKILVAAGAPLRLLQVTEGSVVTNGTFASTAPNGTWTPNTVPDALNDYAIVYIPDLT